MIEVKGLTKRFDETVAVDDLTFTVKPGLVTGFLGPNGAGKTTTMRVILGLHAATRGTATIGGRRYADLPAPMREVGALLDAHAVHDSRRAEDHLLCLALSNGIPRWRVPEVLQLVGLDRVAHRRVRTFSLGMYQRLGIAAALLGDPACLIFDEPINGLDPEGIMWVRTLARRLADEGRTVLISSHLMSEIALTADHLVIIGRGRLLADSGVSELMGRTTRPKVLVRTAQAGTFARRLAARGAEVRREPDGGLLVTGLDSTEIYRLAAADGAVLAELTPHRASLEQIFMELTRDSVQFNVTEGAA
ncbi:MULTISPECIES: ATP-binding cassette domain-containing protein [Actinomadura]|uniref:ATP-binding cassette domain-containing protein n=1 Tax=Actinomadura geliboluensis TaxID=882440 RepID=A0A5S4HAI0_9ACTN|nr:ATP-binding cassette domain-containing protein [Actinomadura geliboluensis]TMR41744.1 ATP-binding cassette domain-containing protein [Actinomadura geliboluensis]